MNNNNTLFVANLENIPIKKGIKKFTVKSILAYLATWTNETDEFWVTGVTAIKQTCIDKNVYYKTHQWLQELGLIKDTGKRVNGNKDIIVYKFTKELNISLDASLLIAEHDKNYISPRNNIKRLKIKAPEQQTMLSENSDTTLSENSDTTLSENSDTIKTLYNNNKTSCVKPTKNSPKSPPLSYPTKENSFEEGEGFLFLISILKNCNNETQQKLRAISKQHSLHSLKCYHKELVNDINKGAQRVTMGALITRLQKNKEWTKTPPFAVEVGGGKPQNQTIMNMMSLNDRMEKVLPEKSSEDELYISKNGSDYKNFLDQKFG